MAAPPLNLEEDSMEDEKESGDEEQTDTKKKEDDDSDESAEDTESEESDSLDETEAEERRNRYLHDMTDLEKQFVDLKEQLFKERITQIEEQLDQVNNSEAQEFTGPLKQLEDECVSRTEVAGHLRFYATNNLENKLKCELQSTEQHFQNEERSLVASLKAEIEEKLRKIEDERHSSDMFSDLWCDDAFRSLKKRKGMDLFIPDKRKKPITVTGPYIVYMLDDMDVLEDWAAIRKAKLDMVRRSAAECSQPSITARYEDGKFFYTGQWFEKGEKVVLDNRIDSPVSATIAGINTVEVWVTKEDGVKCKLSIAHFQKGKYMIRRAEEIT